MAIRLNNAASTSVQFNKIQFLSAVSTGLEEEFQGEKIAENTRRDRFPERFPGIASLPVVNRAFGAIYCHGFPYILALLISITVFTAIKVPYLQVPFTGEHSMKYNTYVEPAFYMVQKDTMLWNQKRYVADPVSNPEGIFTKFDHLPLMEWGLYTVFKLFPDAGMELKTRIVTNFIGILILLYAYLFFCGYFPKSFNVLFIGLLSINPVFSFATYVTVLDSIVMFFMFLSLRQISVFFERKRISSLWWAAIWFGLGNAVKYPLFLWLAPISFLFMYSESENNVSFVKNYVIYLLVSLLVTFATVMIVGNLIASPKVALALLLLSATLLMLVRLFLVKKEESVQHLFEFVWKNKIIVGILFGGSIVAGVLLLRFSGLLDFSDEFLTDTSLVANPRLYKHMLLMQFKNYMTRNLFWFGMFGIALAFLTRENAMRRVCIPFLFGSLVYWVVASKSIFIHIYYSLIIMITLTICAAYFIHFVARSIKEPLQQSIILLCFLSMILPPILDATNGRMQNYLNVDNVIRYIRTNTEPDEFILFEGFLTPLSIYTGRGFVMPAVLINNVIREDIHKIGFANTMQKYRIKYLFTPNERINYPNYAPIFEHTNIKEPSGENYNRNISIFNAIGFQDPGISKDLKIIEEIEKKYNIQEKFVLAAQFGRFKFYSFRN